MDDDAEAAAYTAFEDACAEAGYGEPPRTPEHDALVNEMVRRIQAQHEALMRVFPPRDDR